MTIVAGIPPFRFSETIHSRSAEAVSWWQAHTRDGEAQGHPWNAGSCVLLFFQCVDEVLRAQGTDDVQGIVQHFE